MNPRCPIREAYHGQCPRAIDGPDGRCWQHSRERWGQCKGCGSEPTHECDVAMSIAVCGAPLCDTCKHTDVGHG